MGSRMPGVAWAALPSVPGRGKHGGRGIAWHGRLHALGGMGSRVPSVLGRGVAGAMAWAARMPWVAWAAAGHGGRPAMCGIGDRRPWAAWGCCVPWVA